MSTRTEINFNLLAWALNEFKSSWWWRQKKSINCNESARFCAVNIWHSIRIGIGMLLMESKNSRLFLAARGAEMSFSIFFPPLTGTIAVKMSVRSKRQRVMKFSRSMCVAGLRRAVVIYGFFRSVSWTFISQKTARNDDGQIYVKLFSGKNYFAFKTAGSLTKTENWRKVDTLVTN